MLAVPLTDYYEEVRRYLTCPEEVKDDLIYDVNRKVMDLNADRPDLDYNGILEFLGDPEDLANSLMERMSDEVILLLNNLREQMYRYRVEYLKKEEAYPHGYYCLCGCCSCWVINIFYMYFFSSICTGSRRKHHYRTK